MVPSLPSTALLLLQEQHLEHRSLGMCQQVSVVNCLSFFRLAPTLPVLTPKGTPLLLRAGDIAGACGKYLATLDLRQESCSLALSGEKLATLFEHWLTTEYSPRYRCLTTERQRAWLAQVCRLLVARRLMEAKWEYALVEGRQVFADEWAYSVMGYLRLMHGLPGKLARMAHHIVRDPSQQQALITQFLNDLDMRMHQHTLVLPKLLPPLPEGVPLPFALPAPTWEETYEA